MISCNAESSLVLLRAQNVLTSETVGRAFLVAFFVFVLIVGNCITVKL